MATLPLALLGLLAWHARAMQISSSSSLAVHNELLVYSNLITGSNVGGSFLTPGTFSTDNLSLLYDRSLNDGLLETALDGREADDTRVQAKRFNLTRFYTKLSGKRQEAVVGDYLASFSPYVLNTSLKGARYTRQFGGALDLSAIVGVAKPSWDDVWNNNTTETVDRKFYGLRLAKHFEGEAALGTSLVLSQDGRARFNTTAILQDQKIVGVDWSLPVFHRLWLRGEDAFSRTYNDNPTTPATSQSGWAHLVKGSYSYKRFRTQNELERVSPDYATTGGSAAPDLLRLRSQNQLRLTGPWRLVLNESWFHNNLDDIAGANTSTTQLSEGGARYDGPDWRPTLSAEAKLRWRQVASSATGLVQRTRSVVTSLNDRLGPVDASLDYEFQDENNSDGTADSLHHIVGLGLSGLRQFANGVRLMPSLRFNLQSDRDNLLGNTDQTNLLLANLAARFPWGLDGGIGYSRNLSLTLLTPGADRRSWTASLGYDILQRSDQRVELRFRQNDNRFSTPGQDFVETVWELMLNNRL